MASGVKGTTPPHGVYHRYSNHGCRCNKCRAAWRTYCREYKWRIGEHKPWDEWLKELKARPKPDHGTESRYKRPHLCRCAKCRQGVADARRRRRRNAKAAA